MSAALKEEVRAPLLEALVGELEQLAYGRSCDRPLGAAVADLLFDALAEAPGLQERVLQCVERRRAEEESRQSAPERELVKPAPVVDVEERKRRREGRHERWRAWLKRHRGALDAIRYSRAPKLDGKGIAWLALDAEGGVIASGATKQEAWRAAWEASFALSLADEMTAADAFGEPPEDGPAGEARLVWKEGRHTVRALQEVVAVVKVCGPKRLVRKMARAVEGAGL